MHKIFSIPAALLLALLCACSIPPAQFDELMQAPKLSQEQIAVNNALEVALGTDNYTLKYPRSGEYRSAFVFYDIDMDNVKEAIVFYQLGIEGSGTRIHILDYQDGKWTSSFDVSSSDVASGGDGEIDYIQFENIEANTYENILIGWQLGGTRGKLFSIYTYENDKLVPRYSQEYVHETIRDFDRDGLMDVALISQRRNTSSSYKLSLITEDRGEIKEMDSHSFGSNVNGISQMIYGNLPGGRQALFVDVALRNARYATEILIMEDRLLLPVININEIDLSEAELFTSSEEEAQPAAGEPGTVLEGLAPNQQLLNFRATLRGEGEEIFSADINADGIIEIPSSSPLLGYEPPKGEEGEAASDNTPKRYLTTYSVLKDGAMVPVVNACVNLQAGYLVKFPERWLGKVTMYSENDLGQWQFFKYNGDINDLSAELLRIKRISKNDFQDRLEVDPILLNPEQNGLYQFYGYLPRLSDRELAVTEEELRGMFQLL